MQYLLAIYVDESDEPEPGSAEFDEYVGRYHVVTEEMRRAGVFEDGRPLEPVATATTVRVRSGRTLTTDGPFAETKEQLGGFYLLDCANLDEAIAWAERIPAAAHGSVEIRPILRLDPEVPSSASA